MLDTIITLYCFFDELLKALDHQDDKQAKVSTAESGTIAERFAAMTIATVAAEFFTGNHQKALDFLVRHKYIPAFSKSRFSRRLHPIPESLWQFALHVLAQVKERTTAFLVDSFPVRGTSFRRQSTCLQIRLLRSNNRISASSVVKSIKPRSTGDTQPARRNIFMV